MWVKVPVAGAGTSIATLSVSTTRTSSSNLTNSPSFLVQETIVAFSWSISNLGMIKGTGILHFTCHESADLGFNLRFLWNGNSFQAAVIRNRNIFACQTPHRRINIIKRRTTYHRGNDLTIPSTSLTSFMNNKQSACFHHRLDNGFCIQWEQG